MAQEQPGYPTDQVVCPNCAGSNPAGASFCAHCGQPVQAPRRFCVNCGIELLEDARFCPACGTAVLPVQQPSATPTQQARQPGLPSTLADRGLPESFGLAGRGSRLGAAFIDGFIGLVPYVILLAVAPILGLLLLAAVFILQMVLLTKDGQTLGKKALNIRIVKVDTGLNGGFVTNVLLRFILNGLLGINPLLRTCRRIIYIQRRPTVYPRLDCRYTGNRGMTPSLPSLVIEAILVEAAYPPAETITWDPRLNLGCRRLARLADSR